MKSWVGLAHGKTVCLIWSSEPYILNSEIRKDHKFGRFQFVFSDKKLSIYDLQFVNKMNDRILNNV